MRSGAATSCSIPRLHAPTDRIDATLRCSPTETKPIGQWMPVRLHHAAAEVGARIVLLGDEPIAPGGEGHGSAGAGAADRRGRGRPLRAARHLGAAHDRRRPFLDLRAPARKRRTPERLAQLEAHALAEPEAALAALLDRAAVLCRPVGVRARPRARRRRSRAADRALATALKLQLPARRPGVVARRDGWQLKARLLATLEAFHADNPDLPGIGLERLRLQLEPRLPAPGFRVGSARPGAAGRDCARRRLGAAAGP